MNPNETGVGSRRELKTRSAPWAQALARKVDAWGITPNAVSVLSVVFAIIGAGLMFTVCWAPCEISASAMWFGAAVCIQLRLLCNLIDGMVAIEGGKKSVVGGLYNEIPDRIADPLFLIAAGYCNDWVVKLWDIPLGWVAAVLSLMTAYIRVLGGTLVGTQSFIGPMAKQHRMALLTLACLLSICELWWRRDGKPAEWVMTVVLAIIVVGSVFTCLRRVRLIASDLHKKAANPS